MRRLLICLSFALLCGCASKPPLTREEWRQMATRQYDGVEPEAALKATEQLLRMAYGDRFVMSHSTDRLYARRDWSVFLLIAARAGTDHWSVVAQPKDGGVLVSLALTRQDRSALLVHPVLALASNRDMPGLPIEDEAVHQLFWSRLDYLLGKRATWEDCKMARAKEYQHLVKGDHDALCNAAGLDDLKPPKQG